MCFYHPNKMAQNIVVPLHFFLYVQQIHRIHHALFAMLNVSSSSSRQNRWYVVNSINIKYIECVRVDFSFQPSKLCRVIRGIRANLHWHLHTAETTNTHIILIWCRQWHILFSLICVSGRDWSFMSCQMLPQKGGKQEWSCTQTWLTVVSS